MMSDDITMFLHKIAYVFRQYFGYSKKFNREDNGISSIFRNTIDTFKIIEGTVLRMDEHILEEIAQFRFSLIAPIVCRSNLSYGEKYELLSNL